MEWRLAEAKNRLSELFNKALSDGPQRIWRRQDSVLIISNKDYQKLSKSSLSFKDFLLQPGPFFDDLELSRDSSSMRDFEL